MKDYKKQWLDPRWQKKRLEILERDDFACRLCGRSDKTLHVHHQYYITGNDVWDYYDSALTTLCCDCHELMHSCEMKPRLSYVARLISNIQNERWEDEKAYAYLLYQCIVNDGSYVSDVIQKQTIDGDCLSKIELAVFRNIPYADFFNWEKEIEWPTK